ncbi:MAG: bifunctional ADP-dependent NAD(P)H-hydrate dehydratase/NAD(P)H-hydrate epimerase, partial [Chloroflexota bacterium]|nr:bifunctional ADP-dependent NAD(P)H-hydrate dehydratase/NAD(P)H-hydrate epimerase [Chloroflexota bacterium]
GDTLAGAIGGLLAQGLGPSDAAILGLWLGARAGELARAAVGTLPLRAGDLPDHIGRAIRELEIGLRTED